MVSVKDSNELLAAVMSNESDITIKNKDLSKVVYKMKSLSIYVVGIALGLGIGGIVGGPAIPLVGVTLAAIIGHDVIKFISLFGKSGTKNLYFKYDKQKFDDGHLILKLKL